LRERVDLKPLLSAMQKKTVPVHRHSWIYLLGGVAMFCFAVQVASGFLLMLYYQPTEAAAHQSVSRIMSEVPYGWLLRSIHVWGANLFIGAVLVHLLTVAFTRSYRKPRELTWITGALMLLVALGSGFTGYLLPWNQLAYGATLVGTSIPGDLPGVGGFVEHLLRGGEQVTGDTITRFYAMHVMLLPLALVGLLSIHLALIQGQGVGLPLGMTDDDVRDRRPFFSEFLLCDASVWLVLFGVLVTLSMVVPADLGAKADPLKPAPEGIKPEWYFLFLFQTLKLVPEAVGVALLPLGAALLIALPFLDRKAMRGQRSPRITWLLVALLAYVVAFECWGWMTPGMQEAPLPWTADTYRIARCLTSLAILWAVIGSLVYGCRRLAAENARVRKLYSPGPSNTP
jgi:cytochrome b6